MILAMDWTPCPPSPAMTILKGCISILSELVRLGQLPFEDIEGLVGLLDGSPVQRARRQHLEEGESLARHAELQRFLHQPAQFKLTTGDAAGDPGGRIHV